MSQTLHLDRITLTLLSLHDQGRTATLTLSDGVSKERMCFNLDECRFVGYPALPQLDVKDRDLGVVAAWLSDIYSKLKKPKCETCRHFGKLDPIEVFGATSVPLTRSDHHRCDRILSGWLDLDLDSAIAAEAIAPLDDHGHIYGHALRVLPTFGCVLHEPKS